jgi:AmpD protein
MRETGVRINDQHWLTRAVRRPSPNADARSAEQRPELVVLHCISLPPGRFGTGLVEALFMNRLDVHAHPALSDLAGLRVSAHVFIERRGRVVQFVPFDRRAWHAGVSSWRGRPACNDYAIGIELEGTESGRYTRAQYQRLDALLRTLLARYPGLTPDAIVGHQEIAPGRKRDPGPGFDWPDVLRRLAQP